MCQQSEAEPKQLKGTAITTKTISSHAYICRRKTASSAHMRTVQKCPLLACVFTNVGPVQPRPRLASSAQPAHLVVPRGGNSAELPKHASVYVPFHDILSMSAEGDSSQLSSASTWSFPLQHGRGQKRPNPAQPSAATQPSQFSLAQRLSCVSDQHSSEGFSRGCLFHYGGA